MLDRAMTVTSRPSRRPEYQLARAALDLSGMHCASCVSSIEGALGAACQASLDATVNLATERASCRTYDPSRRPTSSELARSALQSVGYQARPDARAGGRRESAPPADRERRARRELRSLLTAKFALRGRRAAHSSSCSPSFWSPFGERATMWVMLALAAPGPVLGRLAVLRRRMERGPPPVGRHEHADRRRHERRLPLQRGGHRRPAGVFEPAGQLPDVYFDTSAVIIALILLGRLLEARAKAGHDPGHQEANRTSAANGKDRSWWHWESRGVGGRRTSGRRGPSAHLLRESRSMAL